jgi:hypothetical protein
MNEKKNDEFTKKIQEGGFSDIADIIWEGEDQMMNVRLSVEEICKGMSKQSETIVIH